MEFDISNDDLYHHFLDNPHLMNFEYFYWELYRKIHEKIKENDIADPEQMRVVDVLESLLEDNNEKM